MKRFGMLILATLVLSACQEKGPAGTEGKNLTVHDFLRDIKLAEDTRKWCMENVAERDKLPNCVNANQAGLMVAMGGYGKCYKGDVTNRECVDAVLAK